MYVDPHCAHAPFHMKMHKKRSGFHTLQSNCDMWRVTTDRIRSTAWFYFILLFTFFRVLIGTDKYERTRFIQRLPQEENLSRTRSVSRRSSSFRPSCHFRGPQTHGFIFLREAVMRAWQSCTCRFHNHRLRTKWGFYLTTECVVHIVYVDFFLYFFYCFDQSVMQIWREVSPAGRIAASNINATKKLN